MAPPKAPAKSRAFSRVNKPTMMNNEQMNWTAVANTAAANGAGKRIPATSCSKTQGVPFRKYSIPPSNL